ncbi:hypothetical protein V6N13_139986 [Hibiscus sabdariffa]
MVSKAGVSVPWLYSLIGRDVVKSHAVSALIILVAMLLAADVVVSAEEKHPSNCNMDGDIDKASTKEDLTKESLLTMDLSFICLDLAKVLSLYGTTDLSLGGVLIIGVYGRRDMLPLVDGSCWKYVRRKFQWLHLWAKLHFCAVASPSV